MKKPVFSNFFFQFILITLINFALGAFLFLMLSLTNRFPVNEHPLGADNQFILYNNLLGSFLAVAITYFFRKYRSPGKHAFADFLLLGLLVYIGKGIFAAQVFDATFKFADIFWSGIGPSAFRMNLVWATLLVYHYTNQEEKGRMDSLIKEMELARLEELKNKAELEAIQAKFNPHFLYNSLNSISSSIDDDPASAKQMIILLSKFFRVSTNRQSQHWWRLSEEIDLINAYLSIEKIRFGERLEFDIEISDPALAGFLIPRFLIQPIVENAVKHGISGLVSHGKVSILIDEVDDFFEIRIYDNGKPFSPGPQQGYGLRSVHEKLSLLVGKGSLMDIINASEENNFQKHVLIRLPKRASDDNRNN